MTVFDDTLADTVQVAPLVADLMSLRDVLEDDITTGDVIDDARLSLRETTAEAFLVTFALVGTEGVLLRDRVSMSESVGPAALFGKLMSESARIAERILLGYVATLEEVATIEATLAVANGWAIAEELQITDTLSALATYGSTIRERVRFQASLARFLGGDLAETVSLTPTVVMTARFSERTDEVATLGEALTPQLLLHVAAEETVAFDDTDILQMIYAGELRDDVAIEAMSLDPSGDVVTWAVNTRMGFVTQYKDYDFNSFAMINGKYVGANADGLWELDGDTDDGEQIIAGLTGGILQMNSSKRHGLKGVYIGLRGSGEFYLKLTAGDGTEYVYRITARDMDTTKVNIGKGLRHRYLSYSLENVGQDFELESIEFVPMRAFRRV
jgi:hypothetical protein